MQKVLPIAAWLPAYKQKWLKYDVLAGLTVWALVVPQAIAYAQIAGLPPQAGVFASFAAPLGYALFGTSRQLVASPTSATAAISAALVVPLVTSAGSDDFAKHSAALAILCGVVFLVLGRLRMGFLSQFIAPAVQAGFMVGLGLTIIVGQAWPLLGISGAEGPFYEQAWSLATHVDEVHGWTLMMGVLSLSVLVACRRIAPTLPAALIVVVASIIAVRVLNLEDRGVSVVGKVDRAVPMPAVPLIPFKDWLALVPGALAIVVIGYSESMSVARRFADEHRYRIRPNQELVALGAASIFGGVFQGFITSGGASQSAANDSAGARTQVSSLVLAAMAFLSAIAFLPLFRNLPHAVLAAIVINAVVGFVDLDAMLRVRALRRDSFVLACVATAGVLVLGILPGLLITVAISLLYLLGWLSRPHVIVDQSNVDPARRNALLGDGATRDYTSEVAIMRPDAPLLFINADRIREEITDQVSAMVPPPGVIVVDLGASRELDVSGIEVLEALRKDADGTGASLRLVNLQPAVRSMLDLSSLSDVMEAPTRTAGQQGSTAQRFLRKNDQRSGSRGPRVH